MKKPNLKDNWSIQGTMKNKNIVFGHEYESLFNVGDLVSWNILGKGENIGLIVRIFKKEMGKRRVLVANVNSLPDKRLYEVLLSSLSIISSVKNQKVFH